jgi:hypothetical protein
VETLGPVPVEESLLEACTSLAAGPGRGRKLRRKGRVVRSRSKVEHRPAQEDKGLGLGQAVRRMGRELLRKTEQAGKGLVARHNLERRGLAAHQDKHKDWGHRGMVSSQGQEGAAACERDVMINVPIHRTPKEDSRAPQACTSNSPRQERRPGCGRPHTESQGSLEERRWSRGRSGTRFGSSMKRPNLSRDKLSP